MACAAASSWQLVSSASRRTQRPVCRASPAQQAVGAKTPTASGSQSTTPPSSPAVAAAKAGRRMPAVALLGQPLVFGSLLKGITPDADFFPDCKAAAEKVLQCLRQHGVNVAQIVGSAAGLHLPGCAADIIVVRDGECAAGLAEVAAALQSSGVRYGITDVAVVSEGVGEAIACSFSRDSRGLQLHIRLASADPAEPLAFLDPGLTAEQRAALTARASIATTAFLQQQPELFKTAVRLVKHWATRVHGEDWGADGRPDDDLLTLLTLSAYHHHLATAAAAVAEGGTSSSSSTASACDAILHAFLQLAAGLNSDTVLAWDAFYGPELVDAVLAQPRLAALLRPEGCESCPVVLDLANPVSNVAATPAIARLVQLAAEDLAVIEGGPGDQLQQRLADMQAALAALEAKHEAAMAELAAVRGASSD